MKKPDITPGPWDTSRDAVPEGYAQNTVYAEENGSRVATVFQTEANARAIAAVPELLEALEAMLAFRDEEPPPVSDDAKTTDYLLRGIEADDKARSALIKAGYTF